jgi:ethanolamine utilization protein EutA
MAVTAGGSDPHLDDVVVGSDRENPLWGLEHIEITTVGIDIGSATTQFLFSRLELHRKGRDLSSKFEVVSREVLYRSPVHLTPYAGEVRIDERQLGAYAASAFERAGITTGEVDTGAVILTGEATRRENARAIADLFAAESGAFVCATAGHHMESVLAAHGSGAVAASRREGHRILNIDIGGGTTKLAAIDSGDIVQTAALHVGARLAAVDGEGRITRLEPGGRRIAALAGVEWELGASTQDREIEQVTAWMTDAILYAAGRGKGREDVERLWLTEPLDGWDSYDKVMFSGGVSEYIYGDEQDFTGDLGHMLGRRLAAREDRLPGPLVRAAGGIRATVLGASQYSVQISGNTIYVSDPAHLPLHNVRIVRPDLELDGEFDAATVASAIERHLEVFDLGTEDNLAFAFRWDGPPSFPRLSAFADGLERALKERLSRGVPICLVFDGDVGRTMGALLAEERGHPSPIIAIDGISLADFEFVDVGRVLQASATVPVSIKSLIFQGSMP